MKQMLLVIVIHLLILHQYQKDKKYVAAPQKENVARSTTAAKTQYFIAGLPVSNDTLAYSSYLSHLLSPMPYPAIEVGKHYR